MTGASRSRSFLSRILAGGSHRHGLADQTAFLNRRVRLYLAILFWFFAVFTAGVAIKGWAWRAEPALAWAAQVSAGVMATITLIFGLGWRRHRDPCDCSASSIELYESFATVAASIALGCLALVLPYAVALWNLLLTVVLNLVLRAAIVPSSAVRSVLVGLLCTVAVTVPVSLSVSDADDRFARLLWAAVGPWGVIFTLATAIVSRVIYGLQATVREAMQLGNYTLKHKIGEGGMGIVYLARHALLRRPTAIKLLRPDRLGEQNVARFEREVQQTSRLEHPNIVVIYDYGRTPEGQFYYAMEYLHGPSLEELVALEGPMPPGRVIYVLAQVAHALADAHRNGLIHRDVKPANIVLCNRGGAADLAKVVDFGLVKEIDAPSDPNLSSTNAITGTPLYLAPESLTKPDEIDGRADLYALGAIGYFLLTGQPVFDGASVVEICSHHLHDIPERPSARIDAPLPDDLENVVLRCLEKDPAKRYGDALALRSALRACRDADSWGLDEATQWWNRCDDLVNEHLDGKCFPLESAMGGTLAVAHAMPSTSAASHP